MVVGIDVKGSDFLVIGPRPGEVDPIPIGHHDIEVPAEQGRLKGRQTRGVELIRATSQNPPDYHVKGVVVYIGHRAFFRWVLRAHIAHRRLPPSQGTMIDACVVLPSAKSRCCAPHRKAELTDRL